MSLRDRGITLPGSVWERRLSSTMINHPTNIRVVDGTTKLPRHIRPVRKENRSGPGFGHRRPPLVNLGMTIGKGKPASSIMIGRRHIHPLIALGIEKARIIDAVGMFVQKNPSLGRPRIDHFGVLGVMLVQGCIPRPARGIAVANANIAGKAPYSRR